MADEKKTEPNTEAEDLIKEAQIADPAEDLAEEALDDLETEAGKDQGEAEVEPETIPDPQPQKSGGALVPALLGGVVGAGLSVGVMVSGVLTPYLPDAAKPVDHSAEITAQNDRLSALETGLKAQIGTLSDFKTTLADLGSGGQDALQNGLARLDDMSGLMDDLGQKITNLGARLGELETSAVKSALPQDVLDAYESELKALQAAMAQQRTEVEQMLSAASQSKAATATRAALTDIRSALDNGAGFETALNALVDAGQDVPAALSEIADNGAATMAALQGSFAPAARDALAAARSSAEGGVTGFLQRQLGARSVTPKDGDGVDAILSRAEAALRSGDLSAALAELSALPEQAATEMADWVRDAQLRDAATAAVNDLAQRLNSN